MTGLFRVLHWSVFSGRPFMMIFKLRSVIMLCILLFLVLYYYLVEVGCFWLVMGFVTFEFLFGNYYGLDLGKAFDGLVYMFISGCFNFCCCLVLILCGYWFCVVAGVCVY